MTTKKGILPGILLILTAGTLWGGLSTSVQFLFASDPTLTALRLVTMRQLAAGALFVLGATFFMPRAVWSVWRDARTIRDIFISGFLVFASHTAFFEAIYWSNAGTGAVMLTTVPLFAGLWAALRDRRPVGGIEAACFLLATAGVLLIVTDGDFSGLQFSPLAILWGLVSAVSGAAYSIQPHRVIAKAGVIPVVAWSMVAGGLCSSVITPPWTISVDWSVAEAGAFGFIVLFGTIAAFSLYMTGLRYVTPVMAGLLNCAEPLSAFLFSIVLLGDRFGAWQTTGVALVLANVCLLALGSRPRKPKPGNAGRQSDDGR